MTVFDEDLKSDHTWSRPEIKKSPLVRVTEALIFYVVAYAAVSMITVLFFRITLPPYSVAYLLIPYLILYSADFIFKDPLSSLLSLLVVSILIGIGSYLVLKSDAVVIYIIGFYILIVSHRVVARARFGFLRLAVYSALLILSYLVLLAYDAHSAHFVMYGFIVTVASGTVLASVSAFENTVIDESLSAVQVEKTKGIKFKLALCAGAVVISASVIALSAGHRLSIYDASVSAFIADKIAHVKPPEVQSEEFIKALSKARGARGDLFLDKKKTGYGPVILFLTIIFLTLIASIMGVILLIIMGISAWRAFFNRYRLKDDERTQSIFSVHDITERIKERLRAGTRRKKGNPPNSDKLRIRNIYRLIVMRIMKNGGTEIGSAATPREIEKMLVVKGCEAAREATDIYERARYSDADNTQEELAEIRQAYDKVVKRRTS